MYMKFNITKHCKERYIERVLGGLNNSPNIYSEILKMLIDATNITSKLSEEVPRFILHIKETHGSDRGYNFLLKDSVLFILVKRKMTKNLYDVVTCYIKNDSFNMFKNSVLSKEEIHTKLRLLKHK